ncbi:MAG: DUF3971 domain-containing protein [Gammaproteobacteria bacterium]|nr:DUF3971 domain-containing protein [Gammaproteobacteria bacterium]
MAKDPPSDGDNTASSVASGESPVPRSWGLARATLVVATVIAVCFAMLQVGGRTLFYQLHRFEGTLNAWLGPEVRLQGLEGRWRGLNPGLFAEHVRFPGGELIGFDFELDLMESLGRNRVVARRMTVADGRLVFQKSGAGWRLGGGPDGPGLDALALFTYSDEVWVRGRIFAREGRRTAALYVESWLINVGGRHRFSVRMQSEPNCTDCALAIDGDVTEGGPGIVKVSASSFSLGSELDDMLGLPDFEMAVAGDWRRRGVGTGRARLDIELTRIQTPASESTLAARLGAWAEGGGYRGRIDRLLTTSGGRSLEFDGAGFLLPGDVGEYFADLWLPAFSAEDLASFAAAAFGADHPVGRWLHNLAPRGRIDGFRARIDAEGAAFVCRGRDAAFTSYRGVPKVENAAFVASGHKRAIRVDVDGYDLALALPRFVPADETYLQGGGSITFSFGSGHFGLRGDRLWLDRDGTRAVADIALSRPWGSRQARMAVDARVDRIAVADAEGYLPLTMSPKLRDWLENSVRSGYLEDGRILFQGDVGATDGLPRRHFELAARLVDGVVDYHVDWPTASRIRANLVVGGKGTSLRGSARVLDTDISEIDLSVPPSGERVSLHLRTRADAGQLLQFVRLSPVRNTMPFLSDAWTGDGPVVVDAEMVVPLAAAGDEVLRPEDLRLEFDLEGTDIDLADLGLRFEGMTDRVSYQWPMSLSSERLRGRLFDAPVELGIESDDATIRFSLTGSAGVAHAYGILDLADPGIAEGRFDFDAVFEVFPGSEHPAELRIDTDLVGVAAALPVPLDKRTGETSTLAVSLQFLTDYVAVSTRYNDMSGWLHVGDSGILAAALGLGVPVPMTDAGQGRVVIAGGLDSVDVSSVVSALGSTTRQAGPGFSWELRDFRVGRMEFDALELADLRIDGYADDGEIRLTLAGPELHGTLERSGNGPWRLDLPELKVPASPTGEDIALDSGVIDQLIAADVVLGQVSVGDDDYGTWRFGVRPVPGGVELHDVVAELRGLSIEATTPMLWSRDGTTRFEGTVNAGDLRDVLPQWDFVASVESESFAAEGSVHWPGSPLEFDLAKLSGAASLDLVKGRFLDVEQGAGAARIMSLINFSTIVKRISLDFTDVFGRGVSFDRALANLAVTDGRARFDGPAKITGTGLRFDIDGAVDFASGEVDYAMVVTPALHASLPWYAAFLATTNPLAAAGVLFGQQVLKDPIKRLASFDVVVRGPYDDPEVVVVGNAAALAAASGDEATTGDAEQDRGRAETASAEQGGTEE